MTIEELRARMVDLNNRAQEIVALAHADGRDLTQDEDAELRSCLDDYDHAKERLAQLERMQEQAADLSSGGGRKTEPERPGRNQLAQAPSVEDDLPDQEPELPKSRQMKSGRPTPPRRGQQQSEFLLGRGGYSSLGELAIEIAHASRQGAMPSQRLARLAPTTVANEGSGAEGGYAVPPDFRASIMEKVMGEASLLSRTDQIPVQGNTLTVPKDNGTPWGTTGIRAYWGSEAAIKTQSRPAFDTMSLRLNKVYALVPVSDELLEDSAAMDAYIRRKAPEAINFAINLAIIQGTGSNQPLGILNSGAVISVAKETSQLADTIVANNIIKMWSRLWAPSRANAVWLINQDIEPYLYTLALPGRDNTGLSVAGWGSHVFMPAGGLSGSPFATLFGRPIIPTQAMETLGDRGDILLADLSMYLTAVKNGGTPRQDVSIHLWFDYDVTAFRFVMRMTGQPWWDLPVSPRDGTNTLSPFVSLDERA